MDPGSGAGMTGDLMYDIQISIIRILGMQED